MYRRLFAGVALAAGLTAPVRAADVDALLPAETESVLFVNVRQVLDSDLTKKYARGQLEQALAGKDAKQTMAALGLNPLTDIDRVTAGVWGKGQDDMHGVVVVHGKFDPAKLFAAAEAAAKKDGDKVAVVTEGDYKLVKVTQEKSPKPLYFAVADEKTVVGGTEKGLVTAALGAAGKAAAPAVKKALAALVAKQDEKASVFACGLAEGKGTLPPGLNIPGVDAEKLGKQLDNLKSLSLTVRLTADVALVIAATMKDADAAEEFGDTVNQLVGTAKTFLPLVAQNQANLKPLADEVAKTLKSKVKDKDVTLSLKLTGDAIGKAAGAGDE